MADGSEGEREREGAIGGSEEPSGTTLAARGTREGKNGTREWLGRIRRGWVVKETLAIAKIAAPMVANNFFYQVMFTVALVFVGNSSSRSLELDAAALALSFMNVTGVSVGIGLSSAAETLCAQLYGFKNYKGLGIVTQRGIWILGLASFPVVIVWLNTESLLLFIQQDACVARLTAAYVRIFASALPFLYLFFMLQRYLVAQSVVVLFILVGVINNIVSATLHGVFIYLAGLGVQGSAIAVSLATITSPFIVLVYIRLRGIHRQTWGGWSLEGLRGWGQYLRLGVPGLLMVCFEWWCYEFAAFVTGSISNTQLAIHIIIIQILSLNFMLPYGVGTAVTVRVGNELGAGNPLKAKQATYTAFGITLVQTVVVAVFLLATRTLLGRVFSRDQEVIDGVGNVMYVIIPAVFTDSFQGMMQGVLRGTGKQLSGAIINFISFYLIGLPVGTLLAIVAKLGALGMWIGLLIPSTLQAILYFVIVLTLNWEKESLKAIKQGKGSTESNGGADDLSADSVSDNVSLITTEEGEGQGDRERLVFSDFTSKNGSCETKEKVQNQSGTLIEEIPLIPLNKDEEDPENEELIAPSPTTMGDSRTGFRTGLENWWNGFSKNWRLVLSRVCLLVIAVVLLVLGGLASRYQPHRPNSDYCACSDWSGNSTGEWECGNGTTTQGSTLGTVFPNPSTVIYPGSSSPYLMPTSSPSSVSSL